MPTMVGYARCSTDSQDLTAQRAQLASLGVTEDRVYVDQGLSGSRRDRPGLDQALAAVREGDTLVVTKLDRLARSVTDALGILQQLSDRRVKFALGGSVYEWSDAFAKMFLTILATVAEFEGALIRQRTREGMAIARSKGKLRGRQSKLSSSQQKALLKVHADGANSIADLAEIFGVSRPTVYRVLAHGVATTAMPGVPVGGQDPVQRGQAPVLHLSPPSLPSTPAEPELPSQQDPSSPAPLLAVFDVPDDGGRNAIIVDDVREQGTPKAANFLGKVAEGFWEMEALADAVNAVEAEAVKPSPAEFLPLPAVDDNEPVQLVGPQDLPQPSVQDWDDPRSWDYY